MQLLSEKEIEDILVLYPELIEEGLTLIKRQGQLENRRTDLMFKDNNNQILLVELKKGEITLGHIEQIEDYIQKLSKQNLPVIRGMIIGQFIPNSLRVLCQQKNIEWKEIKTEVIYNHLLENDKEILEQHFYSGKLHLKSLEKESISFQEYLNETSPFGVPYTSYQFFKPIDASPALSEDKQANQVIADQFKNLILHLNFDRMMFHQNIRVIRKPNSQPTWVVKTKDGSWQGYVLNYLIYKNQESQPISCEVYLGTIGYRGNKPVFEDETSRFIVIDVGKGKQKVSTQYGFHKYLRTEAEALFPFYELKFSARGLPKSIWDSIYRSLSRYGYHVRDSEDRKSKLLWIGDINLNDSNVEKSLGNLIEALFATTIVKSHFKEAGKGILFEFLNE
ncbi:endonuclease NucS domain-containing protein [Domibacillus indicus]|uniref:endonuclease NucS domain-containing protein n=1 Tax=Domibacillus indicus TaxID=1437523 RepID=UPI0006183205|nr:endonuclease NucS domain-containing protein [Domibacillus indicus]